MNWVERLKENIDEYRPIPFWSWNSDLKPQRLREQINEMKHAGMGGFFMHARSGLKTEYMSDDWFEAIDVSVKEAEKQNMQAWVYDENGWPSGFAGRKLLENVDNLAHYITFKSVLSYDENALANYTVVNNELIRIHSEKESYEELYAVYDNTNASVVDILNEEVVKKFIALTHEVYYNKYKEDFGNKILGFFTDEPQYFRYDTPYSPVLNSIYHELYGEDLLDGLAALFIDCSNCYKFRWRYWKLLNDQITKSFAKQVFDWCDAHNCKLTGHAIEESALNMQMWCCAGVMPFYEYEHIPGCDWLGRNIDTEITPRQVSSVAQQLGKPRVLTESFACTGWDVTVPELKRIIDWQYVNGVNMLCTHLTPYSLEGSRKYDHPAFFCNINPWFKKFNVFSDYVSKLGCMLSESVEYVEVGVIHPMHSAYLTYNRKTDIASVRKLNTDFRQLAEKLGAANIPHHYIDETLLAKYGSVRNDSLCVGSCKYKYIVIPSMPQLDESTCSFLKEFLENGGKVLLYGDIPEYMSGEKADYSFLKSNITFEDLRNSFYTIDNYNTSVRSTYRVSDNGNFIYAVNLSTEKNETVTYCINSTHISKLNLEQNKLESLNFETHQDGLNVTIDFKPGESVILLLGEHLSVDKETLSVGVSFSEPLLKSYTNNSFVIDKVKLSFDGEHYSETMPIPAAADYLLSQCKNREVYLEYSFKIKDLPSTLILEMEKMNMKELRINDNIITLKSQGIIDPCFISGDISPYVAIGENIINVRLDYYQDPYVYDVLYHTPDVTESLINCLTYDTEIDSVYLHGDFTVHSADAFEKADDTLYNDGSDFAISTYAPPPMSNITENGFPFFAGEMTFELHATVEKPGDIILDLNGRFGAAHIKWNEYNCDAVLSKYAVIPKEYVDFNNKVYITLYSGNRNLLGPFHWAKIGEPKSVFPRVFTMNGSWENYNSCEYRSSYAFVPFGIKLVQIS